MTRYISIVISIIMVFGSTLVCYGNNGKMEATDANAIGIRMQGVTFDLSFNGGTSLMKVKGVLPNPTAGQRIALKILDESRQLVYFTQFNSIQGGKFEYTFGFNGTDSDYTLYLKSDIDPSASPFEHSFRGVSQTFVNTMLENVNTATTSSAILAELLKDSAWLELFDASAKKVLNSSYASNAVADVLADKLGKSSKNFTAAELFESIERNCAVALFNMATNQAQIKEVLDNYSSVLNLATMDAYNKYIGLSDTLKDNILRGMATTTETYRAANYESILAGQVFATILSTTTSGYVIDLLEEFGKYMQLTPSLSTLTNAQKNAVGTALAGNTFNFTQAQTAYTQAANGANGTGGGNFGGGSSGGGSGSQGGGSVGGLVNVDPNFVQIEKLVKPPLFNDLDSVPWAKDDILNLVDLKILDGYDDRTFRPNNLITREEYIKILISSFGMLDETAESTFEDVKPDDWFYKYVASAQKFAVARGISESQFGVGQPISRQDMCVLSYRTAIRSGVKISVTDTKELFLDHEIISDYASEFVYTLKEYGIIDGIGDGIFDPTGTATRAQASKVVARLLNLNSTLQTDEGGATDEATE